VGKPAAIAVGTEPATVIQAAWLPSTNARWNLCFTLALWEEHAGPISVRGDVSANDASSGQFSVTASASVSHTCDHSRQAMPPRPARARAVTAMTAARRAGSW
jgi:hypothetical protein